MKAIWKFEIPIGEKVQISMPIGAQIIAFQTQFDKQCIWAIVELGVEFEVRRFVIVGTGQKFEKIPGQYIGTAQMIVGTLIWHLFEIREEEVKSEREEA